ncbi:MAG TPA: sortase [Thermoflexales bacterium]|nr:sortase [Thermoflexales bacterium]HQW34899.1 sortase [Thermoflexales bacterium]HQZ22361.1 sortase [Thermoflexales bacterium]
MISGSAAPDVPAAKPADFSVAPMPVPTYHPAELAGLAGLEGTPAPEDEPAPQATPSEKEEEEQVASGVPESMQPPPDSGIVTETVEYEMPTRIVIPSLKLDAPVERASFVMAKGKNTGAWQLPMKAAGWLDNTSLLGEPGNLVMSGHNNIGSKVFADLRLLNPNDVIIIKGKTRETRYTVVERKLLLEKGQPLAVQVQNAAYILPDLGDTRLTLVTCWPPTNNTYRLIIIAQPQAIGSQ